jgi:hypothetical protein
MKYNKLKPRPMLASLMACARKQRGNEAIGHRPWSAQKFLTNGLTNHTTRCEEFVETRCSYT